MNSRTVIILAGYTSAAFFIIIFFTNNYCLLGFIIGFLTGLFNIQWLFRDAKRALDKELREALIIYHRSLFSRLGMITLVVATIGRFRPEWLFYLALGIAAGIVVPLILAIRQQLIDGRG